MKGWNKGRGVEGSKEGRDLKRSEGRQGKKEEEREKRIGKIELREKDKVVKKEKEGIELMEEMKKR